MLVAIAVQMAFLTSYGSAFTFALKPSISSTEPTIDGIKDTPLWDNQNSTVLTGINGNLLKVYTCVYLQNLIPYIYFALEYKTPAHAHNESFAIACSNSGPTNSSINDSIWSYPIIKTVRIDGKSWDQQDVMHTNRNAHYTRNWTDGNSIIFAENNETSADNASFYEIKLKCQLTHPNGQDLNWSYGNAFVFKIFYGESYTSPASSPYQPIFGDWTVSTPKITITMPTDPSSKPPGISALDINTLVAQIVFFAITGLILGMVGVYIYQTKNRIKRV
ncbi:MAG TPA: hypothetical protein VKM55_25055 [Candidatus Lokiarchaeia archaeon]|nr:hypothetical protein [Candidatus Lokiarchaeia archaeon]